MSAIEMSEEWQETVDNAVAMLEKRTGLKLAGLTPPEITKRVREWVEAKVFPACPGSELIGQIV